MFSSKGIDELKKLVAELSDKMDRISERQNSQFTDVMLQLKELRNEIYHRSDLMVAYEEDTEGVNDELYEKAKEIVIEAKKASTSFIQRKLGVGYSRAARLIDTLEEQDVIGKANGSGSREVIQQA